MEPLLPVVHLAKLTATHLVTDVLELIGEVEDGKTSGRILGSSLDLEVIFLCVRDSK